MLGLFDKKTEAAKRKIDRSTEEILDLEAQKKSLEIDKENVELELNNLKRKMEMQLEEEAHKHKLKLESERAVFDREKQIWEKEKKELLDRAAREKKEFEETLRRESELATNEAITLVKLESQQKIKQAEIDKERAINELKAEMAEKVAEIQASESEKHYEKLTEAFSEMQINGDKNSRFVQELAMKVFDKIPTPRTEIGVDVSTTPLLEASGED